MVLARATALALALLPLAVPAELRNACIIVARGAHSACAMRDESQIAALIGRMRGNGTCGSPITSKLGVIMYCDNPLLGATAIVCFVSQRACVDFTSELDNEVRSGVAL